MNKADLKRLIALSQCTGVESVEGCIDLFNKLQTNNLDEDFVNEFVCPVM